MIPLSRAYLGIFNGAPVLEAVDERIFMRCAGPCDRCRVQSTCCDDARIRHGGGIRIGTRHVDRLVDNAPSVKCYCDEKEPSRWVDWEYFADDQERLYSPGACTRLASKADGRCVFTQYSCGRCALQTALHGFALSPVQLLPLDCLLRPAALRNGELVYDDRNSCARRPAPIPLSSSVYRRLRDRLYELFGDWTLVMELDQIEQRILAAAAPPSSPPATVAPEPRANTNGYVWTTITSTSTDGTWQ